MPSDDHIAIRQVQQSDIKAIVEIEQLAFGPNGTAEDEAVIDGRRAIFPEGFLVAEDTAKNLTVGYINSVLWTDERTPGINEDPSLVHDASGKVLHLTTLAIHPDLQGRGYGTRLLRQLLDMARHRECKVIVLETEKAQALYEKHGFVKIGTDVTKNGTVLDIMRLGLDGGQTR